MDRPPVPLPETTGLSEPYWTGLRQGELRFQRCAACHNAWLPPREECPRCWNDTWSWEPAAGRGRIVSWVVYRQAVHPAFEQRLPYNVAIVELDEGPRMITNIDADPEALAIEREVTLRIDDESGAAVARFVLA